ncbi:MAG TPA: hypothetical protein P5510_05985 [Clostridia bacterium]|jgi:hypothetical protein|nr:hypothetical protein [Clostridia bacterium]
MSNVIWYAALAGISIGIAAYAIYMKRDKYQFSTYMVFYLFSATITWMGEFIVLGLFNSYAYKTGVYQNPWAQNLLGHLFLNTSMFPAAATVMIAYSLKSRGIVLTAVLFLLVEYIFAELGLYEQHWWNYYMSFFNVIAFMLISRKWFSKMYEERRGLTRAVTYYFIAFICIHFPSPILLLADRQHYKLSFVRNIYNDYYLSSIIVSFTYHLALCLVFVYFVCILKKWYWKIVPFVTCITVLIIFEKMNILIIHNGWKLIYTILLQQISIAIFILIEKFTLRPD